MKSLFAALATACLLFTVAHNSFASESTGESRTSSDPEFTSACSYELNPVAGFSVFTATGDHTNKNGLSNTIGFVGGLLIDIPFAVL